MLIKKILETKQGEQYYVKDLDKDMHTKYGMIKSSDIKGAKDGDVVKSNKGEECVVYSPLYIDQYRKLKRLAQIPLLKDIGFFIAELGLGRDSVIGDAGAGSGGVTCMLANIVKKVYAFDVKDEHLAVVEENIKNLELNNIVLKKASIYEELDVKDLDAFFVDVAEPWNAVKFVGNTLKVGGFIVSYSPNLTSVSDYMNVLRADERFVVIKTVELIEQPWEVNGRKMKPLSERIHSGFITIARKLKN